MSLWNWQSLYTPTPDTMVRAEVMNTRMKSLENRLGGTPYYPVRAGESGVTNARYEWGNVRRYGARGDGVRDDTTAIQNAIDSMAEETTGGVVYFPPGIYMVTELTLKFLVSLRGAFPGGHYRGASTKHGAVLKMIASTNAPMLENDRTTGDIGGTGPDGESNRTTYSTIENLTFDGNRNFQSSVDADCIRLTGAWSTTIRSCLFTHSRGFGIRALDCNVLNIFDCEGSGSPVFLESPADCVIRGNLWGGSYDPIYPVLWIAGATGTGWVNVIADNMWYNNASNTAITQPTFTVDAGTEVVTTNAAHSWTDGTPVVVTNSGGSLPGGLSAGTTYYVKAVTTDTLKLATSRANLEDATYVDITSAGSGTHTIGVGENANVYLNGGAQLNAFVGNRVDQAYGHGLLLRTATLNTFTGNTVFANGMNNATACSGFVLRSATKNVFAGNMVEGTAHVSGAWTANQTIGFDGDSSSTGNTGNLASQSFNHSTADVDMDAGYKIDEAQERIELNAGAFFATTGTPAIATIGGSRRQAWLFDAAADEIVQAWFRVPPHWAGFTVKLLWVNAGAGAGNVVWAINAREFTAGDTVNVADDQNTDLTTNVHAASAQDVLVDDDIILTGSTPQSFTTTPGKEFSFRVKRAGTDGSDTLANDAGLIAAILTRASP